MLIWIQRKSRWERLIEMKSNFFYNKNKLSDFIIFNRIILRQTEKKNVRKQISCRFLWKAIFLESMITQTAVESSSQPSRSSEFIIIGIRPKAMYCLMIVYNANRLANRFTYAFREHSVLLCARCTSIQRTWFVWIVYSVNVHHRRSTLRSNCLQYLIIGRVQCVMKWMTDDQIFTKHANPLHFIGQISCGMRPEYASIFNTIWKFQQQFQVLA